MAISPLAGKPAPPELLIDPLQLERQYHARKPDWVDPTFELAQGRDDRQDTGFERPHRSRGRRACQIVAGGAGGVQWFTPGLLNGSVCLGGEESAGASFLQTDGTVWTTDKDGLIMGLLAAEIAARTGKDPGEHYRELTTEFGAPCYSRIDAPATPEQKARLGKLSADTVRAATLAGEVIEAKLTRAPGNDAPIGGLKVIARNGWFTARPSGTENIYKIYAESFKDETHLRRVVDETQDIVNRSLEGR